MRPITARSRALLFFIATAALPCTGSRASAQTGDTIAPVTLPSIDVRVTRSAVPAARLPYPVTTSIVQPGSLAGATSSDAALRGVAGLQVSNRFNDALGERIAIRGIGARAQFGIRGVHVLLDGIPATMPDGQTTLTHLDASAITSTEVLRGSASALWGNASGGVISLRTAPLDARYASGRVDGGANGLRRVSFSGAGDPVDGASAFGRATLVEYDGYRPHAASNKRLMTLGGSWQGGANRAWLVLHALDYLADNPGSLSQRQLDSARSQANPNNVRQRTGEEGTHFEVGGGWQRALRGTSLETSAYYVHRELANPIPPSIIDLSRNAGGLRAALSSNVARRLFLNGGVEAALQSDDRVNTVNTEGTRGAQTLNQAERVTYAAPFAQAVYALRPDLDVFGAARFDVYSFRARDSLVNATNPDDSGTRSMSAPSATVGVRMRRDDASIYGNYATSFQTPTTTELANRPDGAGGFNPLLEPERTRSVEAGGDVRLGNHGGLAASVYHTRTSRTLIPFEVASAPGRQYFRNAGSTVNTGGELSGHATIGDAVDLRGSVSVLKARFDEYTAAGVTYDDKRVPGVAERTAEASARMRIARSTYGDLSARYSGEVVVNDANSEKSPAYAVVDALVHSEALRLGAVALRLSGGMTNLFDRQYNTAVTINAAGTRYFEPGPGRSIYISVEVLKQFVR